MKTKIVIKWIVRVLIFILLLGFFLFSFVQKISNERMKVIYDLRTQQYYDLKDSFDLERSAYQDTIKILRLEKK
jgi:hypothetical protein